LKNRKREAWVEKIPLSTHGALQAPAAVAATSATAAAVVHATARTPCARSTGAASTALITLPPAVAALPVAAKAI
jgi:hypothetical protein